MKVSIITVVYNSVHTIQQCIESVLSQSYPDIEHIVVDGGSTDGTLDVIRNYGSRISKIISEPDQGIYDAMNKGIKLSAGSIVGILNSDDIYYDDSVVSEVVSAFSIAGSDLLYGDICYFNRNKDEVPVRVWKASSYEKGSFFTGWHPPHPALFAKKEVYEKYGLFRKDFRIAGDFELMLRFFEKHQASSVYLEKFLVKMRTGGTSNKSLGNILKGRHEIIKAFEQNGYRVPKLYFISRYLSKILNQLKIFK